MTTVYQTDADYLYAVVNDTADGFVTMEFRGTTDLARLRAEAVKYFELDTMRAPTTEEIQTICTLAQARIAADVNRAESWDARKYEGEPAPTFTERAERDRAIRPIPTLLPRSA